MKYLRPVLVTLLAATLFPAQLFAFTDLMLSARFTPQGLILSWNEPAALLRSAPNVTGPWTVITNASSPWLRPVDLPRAFFRLTINSTNLPSNALPDQFATPSGVLLAVPAPGVLANDSDPQGDLLHAVLTASPLNGDLTLALDGSFTYQPNTGFAGSDVFTYQASNGLTQSPPAQVTILIHSTNCTPVGMSDSFVLPHGRWQSFGAPGVLANDTDCDGDALQAVLVSPPSQGFLNLNSDGSFDYTPPTQFNGTATFAYQATDGQSFSANTVVSLIISNSPPVSAPDAWRTSPGVALAIPAPGVLQNDTDADGDSLTAAVLTRVSHGTLTLNGDGSFNYAPAPGFSGVDTFTYRASDGIADSEPAQVSLTVSNAIPAGLPDNYVVPFGATSNGLNATLNFNITNTAIGTFLNVAPPGVLANDTSPDGSALHAFLGTPPANGSLVLNSNGSFNYQSLSPVSLTDSFSYFVAADSITNPIPVLVTLQVHTANTGPRPADDYYAIRPGEVASTTALNGVLANDTDNEGDFLMASLLTSPAHGSLVFRSDGTFVYAPDLGVIGPDTFTYRVTDGVTMSASAQVTINQLDEAPVASPASFEGPGSEPLYIPAPGVLGEAFDDDHDYIYADLVTGPSHGALELHADGSFIYTPANGFIGLDDFYFTATDGWANSSAVRAAITITEPLPSASPSSLKGVRGDSPLTPSFSPSPKAAPNFTLTPILDEIKGVLLIPKDSPPPHVAVVRNTKLTTSLSFKSSTTGATLSNLTVFVRGIILDASSNAMGLTFPPSRTTFDPPDRVKIEDVSTDMPLPDNVTFYNPLRIRWEFSSDNQATWTPCYPLKTNFIYTLWSKPLTSDFTRETVDYGSRPANADDAKNNVNSPAMIIDRIWKRFSMRDAKRLTPVVNGIKPAPLHYYNPWSASAHTTKGLIAAANGQCDSWARFFKACLDAQGFKTGNANPADDITSEVFFVRPADPLTWFLVKKWKFPATGNGPFFNIVSSTGLPDLGFPRIDAARSTYIFVSTAVTDDTGIEGQNSPNPVGGFNNHVITKVTSTSGVKYYDPSYGTTYTNLEDMTTQALDGSYTSAVDPANQANIKWTISKGPPKLRDGLSFRAEVAEQPATGKTGVSLGQITVNLFDLSSRPFDPNKPLQPQNPPLLTGYDFIVTARLDHFSNEDKLTGTGTLGVHTGNTGKAVFNNNLTITTRGENRKFVLVFESVLAKGTLRAVRTQPALSKTIDLAP